MFFKIFLAIQLMWPSSSCFAQSAPVKIKSSALFEATRWPYDPKAPAFKDKTLQSLRELKNSELKGDFKKCSDLASKLSVPDIEGWVLLTELRCAVNLAQESNGNLKPLDRVLMKLQKRAILLTYGPWAKELFQLQIKGYFAMVSGQPKNARGRGWAWVERLMTFESQLSNEDRAKTDLAAADLALLDQKTAAAEFFVRQSLAAQETPEARAKLKTILTIQGSAEASEAKAKTAESIQSEEQALEAKVKEAIKQNRLLPAVEDALALIKKSPSSKRAGWASDKIADIYTTVGSSKDPALGPVAERMLAVLKQAPALKRSDWIHQFLKNADYNLVLQLVAPTMNELAGSPQSTFLTWAYARSAQFTGDYKTAMNMFQKLLDNHAGTPEAQEALFRMGLISFRKADYAAAANFFERLLAGPDPSRFELSSRYWRVRSLEASNSPKAAAERESLISKFPYSYYGLRLKAEGNKGVLIIEPTKDFKALQADYWLSQVQMKNWNRMLLLAKAGWFEEAQKECATLPLPFSAAAKVVLAQQLKAAFQYPIVIRLINESIDLDENMRGIEVLQAGFPQEFSGPINESAAKQKISPYLVKSLIRQESAFRPTAVSSSNALGLMQMIPPTAKEVIQDLGLKNVKIPEDIYKPDINIPMGTWYIAKVLKQFGGNVPIALAAYNVGPYKMQKWLDARPDLATLKTEPSS